MILRSDRHPTRGDQEVIVARGSRQGSFDRPSVVGQNSEVGYPTAKGFEQSSKQPAICVPDLTDFQFSTWVTNLVAGREERHLQSFEDGQFAIAESGRKSDILGSQPTSRGSER